MRLRRPKERPKAEFDLTPMIDLLLSLIIFFMLTAQFARTTLTPIDLPQEAGETAVRKSEHAIIVDLDQDGRLSIHNRRLPLEAVVAQVKSEVAAAGASSLDVYVRAHRDCAAAHLNALAAELARAGVRDWKLATIRPEGARTRGAP